MPDVPVIHKSSAFHPSPGMPMPRMCKMQQPPIDPMPERYETLWPHARMLRSLQGSAHSPVSPGRLCEFHHSCPRPACPPEWEPHSCQSQPARKEGTEHVVSATTQLSVSVNNRSGHTLVRSRSTTNTLRYWADKVRWKALVGWLGEDHVAAAPLSDTWHHM